MADKITLTPDEQQLVRECVNLPGMKIIAREFKKYGRDAFVKKEMCNPLETPGKYYEYAAMHKCITVILPMLVQGLVNYQENAPDKQVKPKKQWSILEWFRK